MPRGGWRGGGRPPKTEGEIRDHFGCRIKRSNLEWLGAERGRTKKSMGEIIDLAIKTLQEHPEKHYPIVSQGENKLIPMEQIQTVVNQIVEKFHPKKIILFGSYAYGSPTEDSDIDLLIIMPFQGSVIDQICNIRRAVKKTFPLDMIVKTPDEIQWRYEGYDPIIRHALDQGKVLYE